jgi:hypothetical protein
MENKHAFILLLGLPGRDCLAGIVWLLEYDLQVEICWWFGDLNKRAFIWSSLRDSKEGLINTTVLAFIVLVK